MFANAHLCSPDRSRVIELERASFISFIKILSAFSAFSIYRYWIIIPAVMCCPQSDFIGCEFQLTLLWCIVQVVQAGYIVFVSERKL